MSKQARSPLFCLAAAGMLTLGTALVSGGCGTESPTDNPSSAKQTQTFRSNADGGQSTAAENANANAARSRCEQMNKVVNLAFELTESLVDHRSALGLGKKKAYLPNELTRTAMNREQTAATACFLAYKNGCTEIPANCDAYMTDAWIKALGNKSDPCFYTMRILDVAKQGLEATMAYQKKIAAQSKAKQHPDMLTTINASVDILLATKEAGCEIDASFDCKHPVCMKNHSE